MMQKKFLFVFLPTTFLLFGFSQIMEVPKPLNNLTKEELFTRKISNNIFLEDYLEEVMQPMRRLGSGTEINAELIKKEQDRYDLGWRQRQLSELVTFDFNLDTQVSKEEIEKGITEMKRGRAPDPADVLNETQKLLTKRDLNKDGVITYQEMGTLDTERSKQTEMQKNIDILSSYLHLDPNKDGVLTAVELENEARAFFVELDKDKNNRISEQERPVLK